LEVVVLAQPHLVELEQMAATPGSIKQRTQHQLLTLTVPWQKERPQAAHKLVERADQLLVVLGPLRMMEAIPHLYLGRAQLVVEVEEDLQPYQLAQDIPVEPQVVQDGEVVAVVEREETAIIRLLH
jgi:hypothetical protein